MKETDCAWLAGYVDGDGSITITKRSGRKFRSLIISIDSTDVELLDHVIKLVGGSLIEKKRYKDHHRQCYTWRMSGANNIIDLLQKISPYFKCKFKADRSKMILDKWRECTPSNGKYTKRIIELKQNFELEFLKMGEGRGKNNLECTEVGSSN